MFYIIIFIFGLLFGSFFACIGYRIPNKISTIKPNSFCPKCKTELKWYMNIPLFSYIFLKGKCAYCKEKINIFYPLVEVCTALLYIFLFWVYGLSFNFLIGIVLISVFIITSITDFRYFYISDRVIVIGIILILILNYLSFGCGMFIYKVISGISMFFFMYLIKIIGDKLFKRESLGGGDIKLMAFIGSSIGFIPSLFSIFLASIIALPASLIIKNKEGIVPFGPFLLFASIFMWFLNIDIDLLSFLFI